VIVTELESVGIVPAFQKAICEQWEATLALLDGRFAEVEALSIRQLETAPRDEESPARVRIGQGVYLLAPSGMSWAFPYSKRDATNAKQLCLKDPK